MNGGRDQDRNGCHPSTTMAMIRRPSIDTFLNLWVAAIDNGVLRAT
jgi:hypothetical protein